MSETFMPRAFIDNLERWIETQKLVLSSIEKVEGQMKDADRLELILATRTLFRHMIRTLEAFDKWLQDPFIIGHMPRELLEDVQRKSWEIFKQLIEMDINHTNRFKEYMAKLAKEGKLNPLLFTQKSEKPRMPGVL